MLKKRHNTSHVIMLMLAVFVCVLVILYVINYRVGMPPAEFVILAGGVAIVLSYAAYSLTVGRDAEIENVPSDYPPEDIDPVMADCVVDGTVSNRGITAAFYYLAHKGYMEITEYERGMFQFTYLKFPYEESQALRILFRALFDNVNDPSGYRMDTVRLSASADRLIKAVPMIRKKAFKEINSKKNREIAAMAGKVNGFIENLLSSPKEHIEEVASKDEYYLFKIIPYAYTFTVTAKIPGKMENVEVGMPSWYHAYGIDESEYKFDVVFYNAMLRNLPAQLKSEVFDKTRELPLAGEK